MGAETDLVVFSDDWGRHPSSCQHLVRCLRSRYRVSWVNTIGTRRPTLDWYTLQRGFHKLVSWSGSSGPIASTEENPRVLNPLMWPSFASAFARGVNRRLLSRALRGPLDGPSRKIAVTTLPIVADLVGVLPVSRWVYYCVDDLSEWPGLDKTSLERMERALVEKVDEIVVVSERLKERMAGFGRSTFLLTHGVDLDHWRSPVPDVSPIDHAKSPRVVFWGVVDLRLNVSWIEALASRMSAGEILLIGPRNNPDPRLAEIPRVRLLDPVPYETLPGVARAASVLVMPYADLAATRAMQPLKLKEYLATGKPVVVSDLPAVGEWRDACDIVDSPDSFAAMVLARLAGQVPVGQQVARERLTRESWREKAVLFEKQLLGTQKK